MLRIVACVFLITASLQSTFGHGPKQTMVCQTVENIFATGDQGTHEETQRGPRGPQGSRGPRGPPGKIDRKKVEEIVEEKLQSVIKNLQDKIEMLERQVAELNGTAATTTATQVIQTTSTQTAPASVVTSTKTSTTIRANTGTQAANNTTTAQTSVPTTQPTNMTSATSPANSNSETEVTCDIGFKALGTCFFTIVPGRSLVSYEEAQVLCAVEGGRLATIVRPRQLVLLMNYLRKFIPDSRDYNDYWTGMTFDAKVYEDRRIERMNGGKVPPLRKWFPGYPVIEEDRSVIGIEVKKEERSPNQGHFNISPTASLYGVLCDK